MTKRCIVLDANIVVRAILGARVPTWTTGNVEVYLRGD